MILFLGSFHTRTKAAPSFTGSIKSRFINAILNDFVGDPYYYEYYALHDMDGDGIPELLMGRNLDKDTSRLVDKKQ